MSKMKELMMDINELISTTTLSCEEIANRCGCPVSFVNDVVQQRWCEMNDMPFVPDEKPVIDVVSGKYGYGYSKAKHLASKGIKSICK